MRHLGHLKNLLMSFSIKNLSATLGSCWNETSSTLGMKPFTSDRHVIVTCSKIFMSVRIVVCGCKRTRH